MVTHHGAQDRPPHAADRPAQEEALRGDLRRAGPHAVAGRAPPDPRIHLRARRHSKAAGMARAGASRRRRGRLVAVTNPGTLGGVLLLIVAWLVIGAIGVARPRRLGLIAHV